MSYAFQAPFDIVDMRQQMMREEAARAAQQQQTADNISGALDNLLGTYVQAEEKKAKGRAMKNVFGVIAPSLGMDEATLKNLTGNLKSDNDWYNFGAEMGPMLPSLINANQGRMRMQQAYNMPALRASATGMQSQAAQGGPTQMSFPSGINPDAIP